MSLISHEDGDGSPFHENVNGSGDENEMKDYEGDEGSGILEEQEEEGEGSLDIDMDMSPVVENLLAQNEYDQDYMDDDELEEEEEAEYGNSYNCEICKSSFPLIHQLLEHFESHDAAEYAFASGEYSELIPVELEGSSSRIWPNRFLKFPSPLFQSLALQSESMESRIDESEEGKARSLLPPEQNYKFNGFDRVLEGRRMEKFEIRRGPPGLFLASRMKKKVPFTGRSRLTYKCPHCPKEFQRSDHFRQHVANHNGGRSFTCKLCGKRFNVLITLRRHMGTHAAYKPYKCSKCPRRFNQSGHLKRHEESPFTHTAPYLEKDYRRRCRLCFQMFPNDNTRLEHERRVHRTDDPSTVLRCRYSTCRLIHPNMKLLMEHYKKTHPSQTLEEDGDVQGDHEEFSENEGFQRENEENEFQSSSIPVPNLPTPSSSSVGPEECRMCFEFFSTLTERNQHEHAVHQINNPETVLQCKYESCRKILGAKNWLARHIREHRKRLEEENEGNFMGMSNPGMLDSSYAEESLEYPLEHGQDDWMEEDPQLLECRVCDESFMDQRERGAHEQFYHESRNPEAEFVCKECFLPVGNFSTLLFHIKKSHGNGKEEPPPVPPLRPLLPQTEPPLPAMKPLSSPKNQRKMNYTCRHCDLVFTDQQVRLNHEYEAHNTRDALDEFYPCKICTKTMTLRGLRKHLRRIHGQVPVPQNQSEGTAGGSRSTEPIKKVERHQSPLEKSKAGTPRPSVIQRASGTAQKAPTPTNVIYKRTMEPTRAVYVCRLCSQEFDEQRQRETHEHSVHATHSANATFLCKYEKCELEFGTFRALIKHLRTHGETSLPTGGQKLGGGSVGQYKESADPVPHHDLITCRLCWEVFPTEEHRETHESHFHGTRDGGAVFPCKFCPDSSFTSMESLVSHLESHGEKDKGTPIRDEDGGGPPKLSPEVSLPRARTGPVVCRVCDEVLPHVKARIAHEVKVHHTKNLRVEQKCKMCLATLPNFRQLLNHIQAEHHKKETTTAASPQE